MARPVTGYGYLDDVPPPAVVAMAHRGGAKHPDLIGWENTTAAFRHAVELGFHYLETDVHMTADGELVAFHDVVLDRVTEHTGRLDAVTADVLAGARIAGTHPIPRLADLFEEFPLSRFNIDLKADRAGPALARLLSQTGAHDRVCVGSFSSRRLREFRRLTEGRVATSAGPGEVAAFVALPRPFRSQVARAAGFAVLQIPHQHSGITLVTGSLVRRAHAAGVHVHVWTVDDPAEMGQLLDLGVDGLITDRTDLLKELLVARGLWRNPS